MTGRERKTRHLEVISEPNFNARIVAGRLVFTIIFFPKSKGFTHESTFNTRDKITTTTTGNPLHDVQEVRKKKKR